MKTYLIDLDVYSPSGDYVLTREFECESDTCAKVECDDMLTFLMGNDKVTFELRDIRVKQTKIIRTIIEEVITDLE